MKIKTGFLLFIIVLVFTACKTAKEPGVSDTMIIVDDTTVAAGKVRMIFYNMYLPTEMSKLFEKAGANYSPKILNSADYISRYDDKAKIAFNIGIYGVDLSYCRIFGQNAASAKYFSSIQLLYEKLGIPDNYYNDLLKALEKYYSDKDSLAKLASEVYDRADRYLRENKDDAYAAMIVTGGWVEALYIASKIAEANPENIEITERIASQKYSLNSLISLLSNYQEDVVTTEYILMLKKLKKSFDKFDIYYKQENFELDTINKSISTSEYQINISPDVLKEINQIVSEIRSEIVN